MNTSLNSLSPISLDTLRRETGALLKLFARGRSDREPVLFSSGVRPALVPVRPPAEVRAWRDSVGR